MLSIGKNELELQANNCYICKNPRCTQYCPVSTPIPQVIRLYKEKKYEEAAEVLFNNNPLSAFCSIICPHENFCYGNCIRAINSDGVKFYEIERFLSGEYFKFVKVEKEEKLKEKIAIVGAGPAGIALAIILGKKGYNITIFEMKEKIGGVLTYGIPHFRLPKERVGGLERILKELNVKIRYNTLVGPVITMDKILDDGYDAIFIGTGVWNPKPLNIKGETLGNVYYAIDYLGAPTSYDLGENVLVIGAGNVAMDVSRTAKYYGSKNVTIVYRKEFEEMTATKEEIEYAKYDGVNFDLRKSPVEITEEGAVFVDTRKVINEEDESVSWENIEGSEKLIKADSVIIAVSQGPKRNIVANTSDLKVNKSGFIRTDEFGKTTKAGIFASGDVVTGARTVVEAVRDSRKVAQTIDAYCREKRNKQ